MAQHMQVSHSSLLAGMAVFNHGIEMCISRPVPGLCFLLRRLGQTVASANKSAFPNGNLHRSPKNWSITPLGHVTANRFPNWVRFVAFYRCGPGDGNIDNYDNACTRVGPLGPTSPQYAPELAIADIQAYAKAGLIDDPVHLRNKPLYVYVGLKSSTNLPGKF